MKALAILLALTASAWAQSKRYPAVPPDPDRDVEQHSKIWEDALAPGRTEYEDLVHNARLLGDTHTTDGAKEALARLDKAIALLPKEPDAYAARGDIYLWQRKWDSCADDFAAAEEHSPPDDGASPERTARKVTLGICQARAGRYADSERTLVAATAGTTGRATTWMRLGETRIALGKLDEAIGALDTALEMCTGGCDAQIGFVHYLLALAYDRERRTGAAAEHVSQGTNFDRTFTSIEAPQYVLLGAGEADYMLGLAHRYEPTPRLERALVYFRRFERVQPDSPWKRRAEEHVRELSALDLPTAVDRRTGTATPDTDAARAIVAKAMPAMRACMAKLPTSLIEVQITRVGPRTPVARDHVQFRLPPEGVSVNDTLNLDETPRADVEAGKRCVQSLAERIALPAPKERDTYYILAFLVVGS